ncbi:MAG: ribosome assembly cofactor RimP [Flavobacteriaceae bacterium]|nr:ribosome assembly cofactor RimP [Flavobacteriaceae bacterium]
MKEKVEKLLEKALNENPTLFLISLSVSAANHIQIVIDGDEAVSVQNCMDISRAIEHHLDREEEDFSLEVLSAGVTEPLVQKRQYKKNVGRDLKVKTKQNTLEGILVEATDEAIKLQWKAKEPKPSGKGKITVEKEEIIPYSTIVEAKVMIKFK